MNDPRPAHANVRFPPPLVYLLALLLGWALQRAWPLPLGPAAWGPVLRAVGVLLIAAGLGLALWANLRFRAAGTSPVPVRPSAALVEAGPYRWTRNPMYLGLALASAGIALLAHSGWMLLGALAAALVIDRYAIAREERYLLAAFGQAYADYCARVRRWL
ncbi:MAG: isoprenylcysteine carboxylmethyltransferase family protein [Mizugakiibacter sp.]|uniref:methyltransferase family protein n=1 Tax=Mizugakiibacter sp. TaxID=1972610 RepID=UPI0031C34925|nr:isoprenylcysteine carboxylmethyltransferase family protein [Xanthomonadaceae bacterium]